MAADPRGTAAFFFFFSFLPATKISDVNKKMGEMKIRKNGEKPHKKKNKINGSNPLWLLTVAVTAHFNGICCFDFLFSKKKKMKSKTVLHITITNDSFIGVVL